MSFYFHVYNSSPERRSATVEWKTCCLVIAEDDIDCDIMELTKSQKVEIRPYSPETVVFRFHSYYVHDRAGYCDFLCDLGEDKPQKSVRLEFKTSPWPQMHVQEGEGEGRERRSLVNSLLAKNEVMKCDGTDEDPQWYCQPADCVLKYKGKRNFYNKEKKKCEPVVKCNTKGPKGEVIAYYEPETNECNSLETSEEDSEVHVENLTGTESSFTPEKNEAETLHFVEELRCNHGEAVGGRCVCHDGWETGYPEWSSDLLWCNKPVSLTDDLVIGGLYLSSMRNAIIAFALSFVAFFLSLAWLWNLVSCIRVSAGKNVL
eukprot:m.14447 g.14447  ORF g.14447 m.14447 type:complete len:317 (+) comp25759_c0_seq1:1124-2074(+)